MHDFIHHPDNNIVIQGTIFQMDFWLTVEPNYSLPQGYIGRLFKAGQVHHLICEGNANQHQADKNDAVLAAYIARKAEYEAVFEAQQNGAHVANVNGNIVISGPPTLSTDKTQIENDGVEAVTITCDLGDLTATDEIRWSVTAPDGSVTQTTANAVDGVSVWQLTTSHQGGHSVRVETDRFGWAQIEFEGV
jgi:hypothetical protein